ncbi:MAG: YbjN domain-containing protein [Hydrotalea sp.]|nr:YbjN domain-containing protein [Hydrotalea sp.]
MGYYKKSEKQGASGVKNIMKSDGFSMDKKSSSRELGDMGQYNGAGGEHQFGDQFNIKRNPQHNQRHNGEVTYRPQNDDDINKDSNKDSGKQDPIGMIANYFEEQSWHFERFDSNSLLLDIAGEWCRYRFYFSYIPERQFFYVTARIELPIPEKTKGYYSFLLQGLNESMRLGHVDLSPDDHKPVWRFLLPLRGSPNLTLGQLADVLEEALYECDKIYPAFQLFVWGGYNADEAVSSVLFPVMGSA